MEDSRCCGTGTCLIDINGHCWCGQQWNGEQMCRPGQASAVPETLAPADDAPKADGAESQRT